MFDPQKILQQVLGDGGNSEVQDGRKRGISTDTLKGAAVGGLAGLLLGSKQGRELGGSALQMGGLAVLGGLAYKAWQNWEQQKAGNSARIQSSRPAPDKWRRRYHLPAQPGGRAQ